MNRVRTFLIAVVLGSLGRNLDTLIHFLNRLDDRIDAYVEEQTRRDAALEEQVGALRREQAQVMANARFAASLKRGTNVAKVDA